MIHFGALRGNRKSLAALPKGGRHGQTGLKLSLVVSVEGGRDGVK